MDEYSSGEGDGSPGAVVVAIAVGIETIGLYGFCVTNSSSESSLSVGDENWDDKGGESWELWRSLALMSVGGCRGGARFRFDSVLAGCFCPPEELLDVERSPKRKKRLPFLGSAFGLLFRQELDEYASVDAGPTRLSLGAISLVGAGDRWL